MERRYSSDSEVSACTIEELMEEEEGEGDGVEEEEEEEEVVMEEWGFQARAPVKEVEESKQHCCGGSCGSRQSEGWEQQRVQRNILMFLLHCSTCTANPCPRHAKCQEGKFLWNHVVNCNSSDCNQFVCAHCKILLKHFKQCTAEDCGICIPVKAMIAWQAI